jgi:cytochrome P450
LLPLKELCEKFCCCAETILNDIECQNLKKKKIEIDTNEVFEKFIADSISSTVLGLQTNHSDDNFSETHQIVNYIESDFMNFMGSIKMFVTLLMPKRFFPSALREEVREYFYEKVSREIERRKSNTNTNKKDILQTFIDATPKNEMHDELITAQIFTFFAGG